MISQALELVDVIVVDGHDALNYLHGQVSADVKQLSDGDVCHSLILEPTGKLIDAIVIVRQSEEKFRLVCHQSASISVIDQLEKFKIRTAVSFKLVEKVKCVRNYNLQGTDQSLDFRSGQSYRVQSEPDTNSHSGQSFNHPLDEMEVVVSVPSNHGNIVLRIANLGGDVDLESESTELSMNVDQKINVDQKMNVDQIMFDQWFGIPRWGTDFGAGSIPAEVGLTRHHVSFTKGCYTGQELTARLDSRNASLPKRLVQIEVVDDDLFGGVSASLLDQSTKALRGGLVDLRPTINMRGVLGEDLIPYTLYDQRARAFVWLTRAQLAKINELNGLGVVQVDLENFPNTPIVVCGAGSFELDDSCLA